METKSSVVIHWFDDEFSGCCGGDSFPTESVAFCLLFERILTRSSRWSGLLISPPFACDASSSDMASAIGDDGVFCNFFLPFTDLPFLFVAVSRLYFLLELAIFEPLDIISSSISLTSLRISSDVILDVTEKSSLSDVWPKFWSYCERIVLSISVSKFFFLRRFLGFVVFLEMVDVPDLLVDFLLSESRSHRDLLLRGAVVDVDDIASGHSFKLHSFIWDCDNAIGDIFLFIKSSLSCRLEEKISVNITRSVPVP